MPTFENFIVGAPSGFVRGCASIANMESDQFTSFLQQALEKLRAGQDLSGKSDDLKALSYIVRSRAQSTPKPSSAELAAALDGNTVLSRETIAALVTSLENSDAIETMSQLSTDQLVDFKWRLGVAICSSSCKNLSSPYVAVTFCVRDRSGKLTHRSAELSYREFQEFSRTFQEVARIMDDM